MRSRANHIAAQSGGRVSPLSGRRIRTRERRSAQTSDPPSCHAKLAGTRMGTNVGARRSLPTGLPALTASARSSLPFSQLRSAPSYGAADLGSTNAYFTKAAPATLPTSFLTTAHTRPPSSKPRSRLGSRMHHWLEIPQAACGFGVRPAGKRSPDETLAVDHSPPGEPLVRARAVRARWGGDLHRDDRPRSHVFVRGSAAERGWRA